MENWQRDYIQSNLVSLIDEIDSSVILTHLLQSYIITRTENEELVNIGRHTGLIAQSKDLLDRIRSRINAYQRLVKALYKTKQTGPLITLLYGVQINTTANPFRYCRIEMNLAEILARSANFEGFQLKLADICGTLNEIQVIALRETIDVPIYKSIISGEEITVARETIPELIPYHIKRTLTLRNKLDTKIFKDRQLDYFLIKNIEPHQLTQLAEMSRTKDTTRQTNRFPRHQENQTISTGVSSEQMYGLTARFILLEDERHFDIICNRTKDKSIHFINFENNSYLLERSTKPHEVKAHILDDEVEIPEDDFLKAVSKSNPVIIYDTPGMGKSVLLTNLASQAKHQSPTTHVIYFQMQDLVNKLLGINGQIDISLIESEILDTISINKFGSFINRELFNRPLRNVNIFLDAFDEVSSEHHDVAINVVRILCDNKDSYKLYITARPHQGDTLEKICGVIGFGIHPFRTEEQVAFIVEYWQKQYEVEKSNEVVEFAKNCLSSFRDKILLKEREITGIPLQCKLLADVYFVKAQTNSYSLSNSKLVMNTIYDMYREFFSLKFPETQLKLGNNELLDFHFKLALDLLFPVYSEKLYTWPVFKCHNEIFSVGIIEMSKSGQQQFVHRTFAEFLVAEFTASLVDVQEMDTKIKPDTCLQFVFVGVLETTHFDLDINSYSKLSYYKNCIFNASRFKFPVLTFFFGHSICFNDLAHKLPTLLQDLKDEFTSPTSKKCEDMLLACIENNSIGLFTLLTNLPKHNFSNILNPNVDLRVQFQQHGFHSSETLVFQLSQAAIQLNVATHLCSLDVLKLSFSFLSSLTENSIDSLKFEVEVDKELISLHPILVSAQRGNYHIFEFVFNYFTPIEVDFLQIVYYCLNNSYSNSLNIVEDKIQIIKLLLSKHYNTFNADITAVSLLKCELIHLDLILFLFDQGIDALATDSNGETVAHMVASYLSADEYRKFVEWLVKNKFSSVFKVKNIHSQTAVYYALGQMEIKNETLKIIANQCNLTFNEKDEYGKTELVAAIHGGRSVSLLQTLVQFGADINTRDKKGCTVLCHAIESDNIEALEYFLSLGVDPNIRCNRFFSNIWEHVLKKESSILSDMAVLLLQNGADINSATNINEIDFKDFSTLVYRPASVKLKELQLKEECVDIINEKCAVECNASSCFLTLCSCMGFCGVWSLLCCCCGGKPCDYCEDNDLCCYSS